MYRRFEVPRGRLRRRQYLRKVSPGANLSINIANPALWGEFVVGQKYYLDFTPA